MAREIDLILKTVLGSSTEEAEAAQNVGRMGMNWLVPLNVVHEAEPEEAAVEEEAIFPCNLEAVVEV